MDIPKTLMANTLCYMIQLFLLETTFMQELGFSVQILKDPTKRMRAVVWACWLKPCDNSLISKSSSSGDVVESESHYHLLEVNLLLPLSSTTSPLLTWLLSPQVSKKKWCYLSVRLQLANPIVWSLHVQRFPPMIHSGERWKWSSCQAPLNLTWPNSKTTAIVDLITWL